MKHLLFLLLILPWVLVLQSSERPHRLFKLVKEEKKGAALKAAA